MLNLTLFEIILLSLAAVLVTTLGIILWWRLAGERVKALIAGWWALPLLWKIVLPMVFGAFVLHGSVKRGEVVGEGEGGEVFSRAEVEDRVVVNPLHRYLAPTNYAADLSIFNRPTNAVTPRLWTKYSIVDDFQLVPGGRIAGVCGAVTTQPWGIDTPDRIKDIYETYAPLYSTNALIKGVSDFWAVTNEFSQTYVWKDLAHKCNRTNLISFAATLYDWGDIEFTYGNVPTEGFTSFVKLKDKTLDLTGYVASNRTVKVEKNYEQDTEWWLENYPEICYTNAVGDLIFDYDTNEWYFVELIIGYEEAKSEYEADVARYQEKFFSLTNSGEVATKVFRYTSSAKEWVAQDALYYEDMNIVHTDIATEIMSNSSDLVYCIGSEFDPEIEKADYIDLPCVPNGTYTNYFRSICVADNLKIVGKIGIRPGFYDNKYLKMSDAVRNKFYPRDSWVYESVATYPLRDSQLVSSDIKFTATLPRRCAVTVSTPPHKGRDKVVAYGNANRESTIVIVPCRSGKVYEAVASLPFLKFEQNPNQSGVEKCDIWEVANSGGRKYRFKRPIVMSFENADFSVKNYSSIKAVIIPAIAGGSYTWKTSSNFEMIKNLCETCGVNFIDSYIVGEDGVYSQQDERLVRSYCDVEQLKTLFSK